jgi:hypothetical protein
MQFFLMSDLFFCVAMFLWLQLVCSMTEKMVLKSAVGQYKAWHGFGPSFPISSKQAWPLFCCWLGC